MNVGFRSFFKAIIIALCYLFIIASLASHEAFAEEQRTTRIMPDNEQRGNCPALKLKWDKEEKRKGFIYNYFPSAGFRDDYAAYLNAQEKLKETFPDAEELGWCWYEAHVEPVLVNPNLSIKAEIWYRRKEREEDKSRFGLRLELRNGEVALEWDEIVGSKYKVYFSADGNPAEDDERSIGAPTHNSLLHKPKWGHNYYLVTAKKADGTVEYSKPGDILNPIPPPQYFKINHGIGICKEPPKSIPFEWKPVKDAHYYWIYFDDAPLEYSYNNYLSVDCGRFEEGKTYKFSIRAFFVDGKGRIVASEYSKAEKFEPVPKLPQKIESAVENRHLTVTFDCDDERDYEYTIFRKPKDGAPEPSDVKSCSYSQKEINHTFKRWSLGDKVQIEVKNRYGMINKTPEKQTKEPLFGTGGVPAPVNLQVAGINSGSYTLQWDHNFKMPLKYTVTVGKDGQKELKTACWETKEKYCSLTRHLVDGGYGGQYRVEVIAIDGIDEKDKSPPETKNFKIDPAKPVTPTGINVYKKNGMLWVGWDVMPWTTGYQCMFVVNGIEQPLVNGEHLYCEKPYSKDENTTVSVRAINNGVQGEWSSPVMVKSDQKEVFIRMSFGTMYFPDPALLGSQNGFSGSGKIDLEFGKVNSPNLIFGYSLTNLHLKGGDASKLSEFHIGVGTKAKVRDWDWVIWNAMIGATYFDLKLVPDNSDKEESVKDLGIYLRAGLDFILEKHGPPSIGIGINISGMFYPKQAEMFNAKGDINYIQPTVSVWWGF